MDRSVTPGDNFYLYANGDWIKRTVIPADRAGIGVFSALDDLANKNTAALIQEARNPTRRLVRTHEKSPISTTPIWMRPRLRPKG